MKLKHLLPFALFIIGVTASAGTFTTADTLIPVPEKAVATQSGDTAPAPGAGIIHLDARVYLPDGVVAPAPVIVIVNPYGGSKDSSLVMNIAQDFASQG